jgi:hypothetical protein
LLSQDGATQSVKRQSIGSYGTNGLTGGTVFGQTIGQPFSTGIYSDNSISLAPGFQQPLTYKKGVRKAETLIITGLDAFPNPATGRFTVKSTKLLEDVEFIVSDINGRLLFEEHLSELNTHDVECSDWQAGMYFITVKAKNASNSFISKIIITK